MLEERKSRWRDANKIPSYEQQLEYLRKQLLALESMQDDSQSVIVNIWTWPWPGRSTPTMETPETVPPGGYYHERSEFGKMFCAQSSMNNYFGAPVVDPGTWAQTLLQSKYNDLLDTQMARNAMEIGDKGTDHTEILIMSRLLADQGLIDPRLANMVSDTMPYLAKHADPNNAADAALAARINEYPGDRIIVGVLPSHFMTLRRDMSGGWTKITDTDVIQQPFPDLATFLRAYHHETMHGKVKFMHTHPDYDVGQRILSAEGLFAAFDPTNI